MAQPEVDDRADLMVVHASFDGRDEDRAHIRLGQPVKGLELGLDQVLPAAQRKIGYRVEPVEL